MKIVFGKDHLSVIVTYLTEKDGLVLRLQNNSQKKRGITEASIRFLQSIIISTLPIAKKAVEDP